MVTEGLGEAETTGVGVVEAMVWTLAPEPVLGAYKQRVI